MINQPQQGGGFLAFVDEHPVFLIAGAILVAVGLGALVFRKKNTTVTTPPQGDLSGLQKDASGNPIVYRDTADYFYNYSDVEGSYNSQVTNTSTTTSAVTTTTYNGPTPSATQTPPPPHQTPVPQPKPPAPPSKKGQWACTYMVKSGDTLTAIAAQYGTDWHSIYSHNQATIDSLSHAHGNPIPGGPWNNIFPGETLTVPCK